MFVNRQQTKHICIVLNRYVFLQLRITFLSTSSRRTLKWQQRSHTSTKFARARVANLTKTTTTTKETTTANCVAFLLMNFFASGCLAYLDHQYQSQSLKPTHAHKSRRMYCGFAFFFDWKMIYQAIYRACCTRTFWMIAQPREQGEVWKLVSDFRPVYSRDLGCEIDFHFRGRKAHSVWAVCLGFAFFSFLCGEVSSFLFAVNWAVETRW